MLASPAMGAALERAVAAEQDAQLRREMQQTGKLMRVLAGMRGS